MPRSRAFTVLAALLVAVAGISFVPTATQAATRDVTAYIELSSTRPDPSCGLSVAIEVRSDGAAVSNTEVSVALFAGSEPVSIDTAATDGNGVAHLSVDTSAIGSDGWLDVNVSGSYLTGYAIVGTSGNSCSAESKYDVVEGGVSIVTVSGSSAPSYYTYQQQRTLSCEYAAVHIASTFWGNGISEYDLDSVVGWDANPHLGYRGDINGTWGNTTDYGVYNEALAAALPSFGFAGDAFYGVGDTDTLTSYLASDIPVIVWVALWGDQSERLESDGVGFTVTAGMHVMVAYSYDANNIYLSDPGSGSLVTYSWGSFIEKWNVLDGMALAVYPR
jgi:uncharacterized protein YvpB